MFDFSASDPVDLIEGDQLSVADEVRVGDIVWLERVAEHEVVLRVAAKEVRRTPGVKLYRIEREQPGDATVLRRVDGDDLELEAESAHPLGGYAPYFRDAEIPAGLLGHYVVGQILYEPSFCDATYKFGGFLAPHRYLIISASARCLDAFSAHPEWGLCVWPRGRLLKVIDTAEDQGHVQITLLDLTEDYAAACEPEKLAEIERFFAAKARELFAAALDEAPLPELDTDLWRERLVLPIGIDDEGRPFPCPR